MFIYEYKWFNDWNHKYYFNILIFFQIKIFLKMEIVLYIVDGSVSWYTFS